MIELTVPLARRRPTRILCIGAHGDDIEIGCGGTLLKLLARAGAWDVTWAVFSADAARTREVRASARRFLRRAHASRVLLHAFADSYFPAQYQPLKQAFAALQKLPEPDVIFTHQRDDRHQDHRLLSELTWNAFRHHLVLEYEIPKFDGGLSDPAVFVPLTRAQVSAKARALLASYPSQRAKPWFTASTFEALMRLRGVESGAASGWAEGFHVRKLHLA
jgi:LmbE family N-acetylglucosaminyl deacetylase